MGWFKKLKKKIRLPRKVRSRLKINPALKKLSIKKVKKVVSIRNAKKVIKAGLKYVPGGAAISQGIEQAENAYDQYKRSKTPKEKMLESYNKSSKKTFSGKTANLGSTDNLDKKLQDQKSNKMILLTGAAIVAYFIFMD